MSSEAETQQPPAAPAAALSAADTKPGSTGSGAGSGGPGGLTSAAPAGGDKKVIGERQREPGMGPRAGPLGDAARATDYAAAPPPRGPRRAHTGIPPLLRPLPPLPRAHPPRGLVLGVPAPPPTQLE